LDSSSAIWIVSARPEAAAVSFPSAVPFEMLELFAAVSRRSRRAPVCTETILMREGSIWRSVAKLSMKLAPSNSSAETETVRDSCTTWIIFSRIQPPPRVASTPLCVPPFMTR